MIQRYKISKDWHKHPDRDGEWCLHIDADAQNIENKKVIAEQASRIDLLKSILSQAQAVIRVKYGNVDISINRFIDEIEKELTK